MTAVEAIFFCMAFYATSFVYRLMIEFTNILSQVRNNSQIRHNNSRLRRHWYDLCWFTLYQPRICMVIDYHDIGGNTLQNIRTASQINSQSRRQCQPTSRQIALLRHFQLSPALIFAVFTPRRFAACTAFEPQRFISFAD
jgi:hypothetical protein